MSDRPRAAILARVSSDGQHVDTQLAELRTKAARDGADVVAEYVDDGISGKTGNLHARTETLRMLADLRRSPRPFDVLYVWDLDRLARSDDIEEQGAILGPLQRSGVEIHTRTGAKPSLSTMVGRFVAHLELEAAADWLVKHKDRIKAGKARALAAGRKPAGPTPYGLAYNRERGEWSIDEPRAAVVRRIFAGVIAGRSCEDLAHELNAEGVPRVVRRERAASSRKEAHPWTRERVWRLVTRRTYAGEWTADKRRGAVLAVPPIVDLETFERAQEVLVAQGRRGLRRTKHVYLLEGIARCEACGSAIRVSAGSAKGHRAAYYYCRRRWLRAGDLTSTEERCTAPIQRVDRVDERLWRAFAAKLSRPDLLAEALEERRAGARGERRDWEGDLAGYERKLRELERRQGVLAQGYAAGDLEERAYAAALERGRRERQLLQRQIETARAAAQGGRRQAEAAGEVLATLETLRERVLEAPPEERRTIVRRLVPGVGAHVVTLGATIEARALLPIARPAEVSPALLAGSSLQRETQRGIELRIVA